MMVAADPAATATPAWQQPTGFRVCSRCGAKKKLQSFFHDPSQPRGVSQICKSCTTTTVEQPDGQKGGASVLKPTDAKPVSEIMNPENEGKKMSARDVRTDDRGAPRLSDNLEVRRDQALRMMAAGFSPSTGEPLPAETRNGVAAIAKAHLDADYLPYARAAGILMPGMNPADLPSVRGW